MAGQGRAAGDQAQRIGGVGGVCTVRRARGIRGLRGARSSRRIRRVRQGQAVPGVRSLRRVLDLLPQAYARPPHAIDDHAAAGRRHAQAHRAFGQAIDRNQAVRVQAVAAEGGGEARQGVGVDRLGAVCGQPPGGQVEPFELGVDEAFDAQFEGEVGRRRDRAAVLVDRPQPALGAGEEVERRHQHQGAAVVQAAEPGADQAHVVVERQPAHAHVLRPERGGAAPGADVGEQVGVAQRDALGVAGGAGGVLDEAERGAAQWLGWQWRAAGAGERVGRADMGERRHQSGEHARERAHTVEGDQHPRLAVAQDAGLAAQVLLDLIGACGRIHRHRHCAGEQDAEEAAEEVQPRGQHQRHAVARAHAERDQRAGEACGGLVQLAAAQCLGMVVIDQKADMGAPGMAGDVPFEHLDQGRGGFRERGWGALRHRQGRDEWRRAAISVGRVCTGRAARGAGRWRGRARRL